MARGWLRAWAASLLLLLLQLVLVHGQGCEPYKQFDGHTMCVYKAKSCPGFKLIRSGGLTEKHRQQIVDYHNKLRQSIVDGKVKGAPKALSMKTLVWDEEIAKIAQRSADQCRFEHDKNRRIAKYQVGQNIFMASRMPVEKNTEPDFKFATDAWFNEIKKPGFSSSSINPFTFSKGAGHYTQIAWADTNTIGCGYTMFSDKGWSKKLVVCNYGPAGNIIGGRMYEVVNPFRRKVAKTQQTIKNSPKIVNL